MAHGGLLLLCCLMLLEVAGEGQAMNLWPHNTGEGRTEFEGQTIWHEEMDRLIGGKFS